MRFFAAFCPLFILLAGASAQQGYDDPFSGCVNEGAVGVYDDPFTSGINEGAVGRYDDPFTEGINEGAIGSYDDPFTEGINEGAVGSYDDPFTECVNEGAIAPPQVRTPYDSPSPAFDMPSGITGPSDGAANPFAPAVHTFDAPPVHTFDAPAVNPWAPAGRTPGSEIF